MRQKIFMVWVCFMLIMGAALPLERACAETLPVLVIGSDEYEPYNYVGADGTRQGVDVELATEALRRMGYTAQFRQIVWENKDDDLEDGTVDCLWGSFSMNGREDNYTWAGPYLYSRQVVVTRVDSGIASAGRLGRQADRRAGYRQGRGRADSWQRPAGIVRGGRRLLLLHHGRGVRQFAQELCGRHRGP